MSLPGTITRLSNSLAHLFGCGKPEAAVERRLDATGSSSLQPRPELRNVLATQAGQRQTRFADLSGDPSASDRLPARAPPPHLPPLTESFDTVGTRTIVHMKAQTRRSPELTGMRRSVAGQGAPL